MSKAAPAQATKHATL